MASDKTLQLTVITQDRELFSRPVSAITAETTSGEITVLPDHISLFTELSFGELRFETPDHQSESLAVSKGFLDVNHDNTATVIVDSAVEARNISLEKAQDAIKAAQETLATSTDKHELIMAEASLRQALLETKLAQKTKKARI